MFAINRIIGSAQRIIILILLSVMVSSSIQPAAAAGSREPAAPAVLLTPASAAPGATILVQGQEFTAFGSAAVRLDSIAGQLLGKGQFGVTGSVAVPVMIPPDAAPGVHTIWVINEDARDESASAVLEVMPSSRRAVFLYGTPSASWAEFKGLLDGNGLATDLLQVSAVNSATDFSPYSLILVGPDTGDSSSWGTQIALQKLARTNKPVLGIGEGGYAYFGKRSLAIGYPNGNHLQINGLFPVNSQEPLFKTPNLLTIQNGSFLQVFDQAVPAVDIYLPNPSPKVYRFGSEDTQGSVYYPLIQQGKYFLWGFGGLPSSMTDDGRKLLVNVAWHLATLLEKDTLVLTNRQRFTVAGYMDEEIFDLTNAVNTLVGLPSSTTNMKAIQRDLSVDAPLQVIDAYNTWTMTSVQSTNSLATQIDGYLENLKGGAYPNLKYIILVGSHEVIPMKARAADNYHENSWSVPPSGNYMNSIIQSTFNGALGYYLTDTIYSDLSYFFDGWGIYRELVPELAVGRLVETPEQITSLVNTYISSHATLSRIRRSSIASWDYMDGGTSSATFMGSGTDTTLIQANFNSSLVPPLINAKNDLVYMGGHGDYNWMTTGSSQGFMAGATGAQGDTEELVSLPDAVIVAAGCHNGFNITSLHHAYDGTTNYGDFPERFANKQVGIYVASTGYTWVSISGASKSASDVMYSERVASLFMDRLLNHGSVTAGQAFQQTIAQYITEMGGLGDNAARRVVAIATLYGIPNYRWQTVFYPDIRKAAYSLRIFPWLVAPTAAPLAAQQVVLDVNDWSITPEGVVEIPGASYNGDKDHPVLPVIQASWLLPEAGGMMTPTLNLDESTFITITNDIPPVLAGTFDDGQVVVDPGRISEQGFFPFSTVITQTVPAPGGGGIKLGLNISPVQYDKDLHQTRIWTHLVIDVETSVNPEAGIEDTDGDNLPDYWENGSGLDADDPNGDQGAGGDPDQDGLTNLDELQHGTDPLNPDTDQDGWSDGQEVGAGYDPLNPGVPVPIYLPVIQR